MPALTYICGMLSIQSDEYFMRLALQEAQKAADQGEVPIGAVIVSEGVVLARAHNQTELLHDVTAHAEMLAITSASAHLNSKYLPNCTLYVTLEPCPMCAGALRWSQIGRIVYGAEHEKGGFMQSGKKMLHPKTKLEFGILADQAAELLQTFFGEKRRKV